MTLTAVHTQEGWTVGPTTPDSTRRGLDMGVGRGGRRSHSSNRRTVHACGCNKGVRPLKNGGTWSSIERHQSMYYVMPNNESPLHNTSITRVCRYTSPAGRRCRVQEVMWTAQDESAQSRVLRDVTLTCHPPSIYDV